MSTSDPNSQAPRAGPKVFISYRRRSDQAHARLLRQDLAREFGDAAVFRDVERIGGGEKFLPKIRAALRECNTFLAVVSPEWLEAAARLRDPEDFVRMEIAAALASDAKLIPLLLNGAQMPSKKELPDDIKEFAGYQAEELRDTRWEDDVRHLVETIRAAFPEPPPPSIPDKLRDAARRLAGTWYDKAALAALGALILAAMTALVWFVVIYPAVKPPVSNARLTTPTPLPTATPARVAAATPTPRAKCLREFLPEGRWASINYGDPDERVVVRREQPKDETAGILLTHQGREVGAIRFRFLRHGKDAAGNDSGYYEIEQVVGPDCRPSQYYAALPDELKAHKNYDWVSIMPGSRRYDLRLAYTKETIIAVFRPNSY